MPIRYIKNRLHLVQGEQTVDLATLAHGTGRPFYLYDLDGIEKRFDFFQKSVHPAEVYFSLKCNNNLSVVHSLIKKGGGLDIVSLGELQLSLKECSPKKIVFSGVGKTKEEIEQAVRAQIFQINVESLQELDRIGQVCTHLKMKARVAFRMNPNVILETHSFIQTGTQAHKFGMEESLLPEFLERIKKYSPFLIFQGLAMHIGSQGLAVDPILKAARIVKNVYENLNINGQNLTTLDIGGGVGIDYRNEDHRDDEQRIEFYGSQLKKIFKDFQGRVLCEPGRVLAARYGWLFGEIQYIKKTTTVQFAILNTGMHHLIRPVLYQGYHRVLPLIQRVGEQEEVYTLAGPICESSDILARDRKLPLLRSGDGLVFCDVGAYGAVMASSYNMQEKPLELAFSQGHPVP